MVLQKKNQKLLRGQPFRTTHLVFPNPYINNVQKETFPDDCGTHLQEGDPNFARAKAEGRSDEPEVIENQPFRTAPLILAGAKNAYDADQKDADPDKPRPAQHRGPATISGAPNQLVSEFKNYHDCLGELPTNADGTMPQPFRNSALILAGSKNAYESGHQDKKKAYRPEAAMHRGPASISGAPSSSVLGFHNYHETVGELPLQAEGTTNQPYRTTPLIQAGAKNAYETIGLIEGEAAAPGSAQHRGPATLSSSTNRSVLGFSNQPFRNSPLILADAKNYYDEEKKSTKFRDPAAPRIGHHRGPASANCDSNQSLEFKTYQESLGEVPKEGVAPQPFRTSLLVLPGPKNAYENENKGDRDPSAPKPTMHRGPASLIGLPTQYVEGVQKYHDSLGETKTEGVAKQPYRTTPLVTPKTRSLKEARLGSGDAAAEAEYVPVDAGHLTVHPPLFDTSDEA